MVQSLVRYGYVPFMVLGLNGVAYAMVAAGWNYGWLLVPLALAVAAAFAAERVLPVFDEWNQDVGDGKADAWHALVYEVSNINSLLLLPLIAWLTPWDGFWPTHWPLAMQFLVALIWVDFGLMYVHYLSHRFEGLWRLHAVHHGVGRMYGFNGLVRHPLHQTIDLAVVTGPLALIGMPLDVAVLLGFVISVQLVVQHSNVAHELGPFRNWLSIGHLHHLHHVNWGKEGDCNFGLFLTVWDRLLGTFNPNPPRPIRAHDMGVDDLPAFPRTSFLQQMVLPLTYKPGAAAAARQELEAGRAGPA